MSTSDYSYLDLTVMGFLRKRVLSQDAAVLFSPGFERVLWANAFGARLFSGSGLADLLDVRLTQAHPLIRQIANAIRQVEDDEPVVRQLRISHGLNSELIASEISRCVLPNGEEAILLVCPYGGKDRRLREHQLAAEAVSILEDFAAAAAVLDEFGLVLAASQTFEDYAVDTALLEDLVREVDGEADRLVKRPVPAGDGRMLPAGVGKIRDHPARFLAVLADDTAGDNGHEIIDRSGAGGVAIGGVPLPPPPPAVAMSDGYDERHPPEDDMPPWLEPVSDPDEDDGGATVEEPEPGHAKQSAEEPGAEETPIEPADDGGEKTTAPVESNSPIRTTGRSLLDRWYFGTNRGDVPSEKEESSDQAAESAPADTTGDPSPMPVQKVAGEAARTDKTASRFAFVIDREQVIRSVSDGLAAAVGEQSADIVGKHWKDVAAERGFDEDGAILDLLSKSDTWSGRSVLWPIEGTDMNVPVDLAALPAYDRERNFDGYRGFGVIRLADTMVDPLARGMKFGSHAIDGDRDASIADGSGDAEEEIDLRTGWSTDIASEDDATGEAGSEEALEGAQHGASGNVYHLSDRQSARDDITAGGADDGAESDSDDGNLSGREKRNFSEIRRSLSPAGELPEEPVEADGEDEGETALPATGLDPDEASIIFQGGRTLHASPALLKLTGYGDVETLQAAGGLDALITGKEENGDADDHARDSGMQLRCSDGETVSVRCRLQRLKWGDGNALAMSFSEPQQSKAEEKIALDMVRVSELENILDTAADGIATLDANGLVQSLNPSGEALFGISQTQAIGEPFVDLFSSESHHQLLSYMESIARNGDENEVQRMMQQGFEATGVEANGRLIPLFVTLGKVGREGNLCAVLRDLTDWKKTEQELIEARKSAEDSSEHKTRFLSQVSHEIREPLTAIIGFSDIMLEERFGPVGNERYRGYLRDINRSGGHVLDLVNDLLNISKIESGKLELEFEAVDLNRLVSETVSLLQPQANRRRIITRTSLSQAVPKVVADARSIRQVILNLVGNAINHSPDNTQVIVSTALEENGEVALRVRDNGDGMSPVQVEQVLQAGKPFDLESVARSDQARENAGEAASEKPAEPASGTSARHGMGLPLTKALVEANRAYFELESKPGEGTVVHVLFPSQRVLAD
ncbi:PAS domain S-box protein [Salaquimonas pukyongi]|uniref:PAS domain S-box protein n=1 Tax=Salaquimonas pukyongi TaxID=2712698 RepID=UPI00096B7B31|nr:PAS domain S-box protein [Salaquimonas pukyongi]